MKTTQILKNPVCDTGMHLPTEGDNSPSQLSTNIIFKFLKPGLRNPNYIYSKGRNYGTQKYFFNEWQLQTLRELKIKGFTWKKLRKITGVKNEVTVKEFCIKHFPELKKCNKKKNIEFECIVCKEKFFGVTNQKYCIDCKKSIINNRKKDFNNNKKNREKQRLRNRIKNNVTDIRYEIKNCIICNKNISMYPSHSKYCQNCGRKLRKDVFRKNGAIDCSPYMCRKYDINTGKILPDFELEIKRIKKIKSRIGI